MKFFNIFYREKLVTFCFILTTYIIRNSLNHNKFYKILNNKSVIEWMGLNSRITLDISHTTDQQKLGMESLAKKNQYSSIMLTVFKKLIQLWMLHSITTLWIQKIITLEELGTIFH